jgi:hypothetical protein
MFSKEAKMHKNIINIFLITALLTGFGFAGVSSAALLADQLSFPLLAYKGQGELAQTGLFELAHKDQSKLKYNAANDKLSITALPVAIRLSPLYSPTLISGRSFTIDVIVDENGELAVSKNEKNLSISGMVVLPDGTKFAGNLLTGKVSAFGYQDSGGPTDQFDFRFKVTGGELAIPDIYPVDSFVGVFVTSESSDFGGTFSESFRGNAKGTLGLLPIDCELIVEKECEVPPPPEPGSFDCKEAKPIDSLTMIWNGGNEVLVSATAKDTVLADKVSVMQDEAITISGYAAAKAGNDVIWEIFDTSGKKIGESTFHRSCSDKDMNGPEDCGKLAGDGKKNNSDFMNDWLFEGMAGEGQSLDCTADIFPEPTSECEIVLSPGPDCETVGKPTSLTFIYTGGGCLASNSEALRQNKKPPECIGTIDPTKAVKVKAGDDNLDKLYSVTPSKVLPGEEFTISADKFDSNSLVKLSNRGGVEQNSFHTSCSAPLEAGDQFGSIMLVAINGQRMSNEVTYTYRIRHTGGEDVTVDVFDDKLGYITPDPVIIPEGKTVELMATAMITEDTTNTVTVTDLDKVCAKASATATVTIDPCADTGTDGDDVFGCIPLREPFDCKKPIDALTMVWEGEPNEAIRIKAYKDDKGKKLLTDIDGIMPGDEITVSGYAGSKKDVIWEIFEAGTEKKIGKSTFHLSCSDKEMNGPEDCGKWAGNGKKDKKRFINDWLLKGMTFGNGASFYCND